MTPSPLLLHPDGPSEKGTLMTMSRGNAGCQRTIAPAAGRLSAFIHSFVRENAAGQAAAFFPPIRHPSACLL